MKEPWFVQIYLIKILNIATLQSVKPFPINEVF